MTFSIIGGDKRFLHLKTLLEADHHIVHLHGFDKLSANTVTLEEAVNRSDYLVCGVPFAKDGHLFAPFSSPIPCTDFLGLLSDRHVLIGGGLRSFSHPKKVDLLDDAAFIQYNAIPTAEGVIKIAIEETNFTLNGATVVIVGFGRIGSITAKLFAAMGSHVTVVTPDPLTFSQSVSHGFRTVRYEYLIDELLTADILVSTPPGEIITSKHLLYLDDSALIIDISSVPYGVTQDAIKYGIKTIWARALPGIVAPYTGAIYIRDALYEGIRLGGYL